MSRVRIALHVEQRTAPVVHADRFLLRTEGRAALSALLGAAVWALVLASSPALALGVADVVGERVENLGGQSVGHVDELIVDINTGRVIYVIVDRAKGYETLPIRAIHGVKTRNRLQIDMTLAGSAVQRGAGVNPHLRRATKLIGQTAEAASGEPLGVIQDIEFEPESGLVIRVVIATADGKQAFPARVLTRGRFSPATRWQPGPQ